MENDTFQKPEKESIFSEFFQILPLGTFSNGFQSVIIYLPT